MVSLQKLEKMLGARGGASELKQERLMVVIPLQEGILMYLNSKA